MKYDKKEINGLTIYPKENEELKQKIENKIEELNKKEKQELKGTKGQDRYYIKQQYMYKKNVLEELREDMEFWRKECKNFMEDISNEQ